MYLYLLLSAPNIETQIPHCLHNKTAAYITEVGDSRVGLFSFSTVSSEIQILFPSPSVYMQVTPFVVQDRWLQQIQVILCIFHTCTHLDTNKKLQQNVENDKGNRLSTLRTLRSFQKFCDGLKSPLMVWHIYCYSF